MGLNEVTSTFQLAHFSPSNDARSNFLYLLRDDMN